MKKIIVIFLGCVSFGCLWVLLFWFCAFDSINTAMPGIPDYYANSVRLRIENHLRAEQSPCTTDSTGDRK